MSPIFDIIRGVFIPDKTIAIVTLLLLASGCTGTGLAPSGQLHQPAPNVSLPALDDRQISLSQLKGKVVVLDFWATWCPPCREGFPHLQSLAANVDMAQRGLTVLAVNEEEKPAEIRAFLDQAHYSLTVVQDSAGLAARAYGVSALPTTIVVGRDGLVQAVISGWTPDTAHQIDDAVAHALEAPAPGQVEAPVPSPVVVPIR